MAQYCESLTENEKTIAYFCQMAETAHAKAVCSAVRESYIALAMLAQKVECPEAHLHLRFGAARRAGLIGHCLQDLLERIPPNRNTPISYEDVAEITKDLNVIYINIRGSMDNIASCVQHLLGGEDTRNLDPMQVDLFGEKFLGDANFCEIKDFLNPFGNWNAELKDLRNSSAHRIPLSVPPAVLSEDEKVEYKRLIIERNEISNKLFQAIGKDEDSAKWFEEVDVIEEKIERLGTFSPIFVHHPSEKPTKVYSRVPEDIGKLIKITRGITKIISKKLAL